ncbi:MAG: hypothetical protein S4CHLAM123_06710 [Chlamydiales bacterium]|nr:hypothetical protein [Chlamydiales bacterium]
MEELSNCTQCGSEYTYEVEGWYTCPDCAHEWQKGSKTDAGLSYATISFYSSKKRNCQSIGC